LSDGVVIAIFLMRRHLIRGYSNNIFSFVLISKYLSILGLEIFLLNHQNFDPMANVFYQTSMQLVFAVKHRDALILPVFSETLHKYIGGILKNNKHKPLAINSMPDHIHIFFGMHPCDIPVLVRDVKSSTSTFINQNGYLKSKFHWQEGYGLFSYSMSHRSRVINYIDNQQEHHGKRSFREEYLLMLRTHEIEFDEKYLFDFFE
jgi:putative transposase